MVRGKATEGTGALFLWISLLSLAVVRFDRLSATVSGGLDHWIASATLLIVLAGVWWWSFAESRKREGGRADTLVGGVWHRGWRVFRRNRIAMLGLGIVVAFYLGMLLTPLLAPFEPEFRSAYQAGGDMASRFAAPSSVHIMGTDQFSQDIFTRILYGARISLTIGLLAVGISVTLGTFLGALAGDLGGWVDTAIMRFVDMIMAIPRLVVLIAIVAFFQRNIFVIIAALAFTQWPFTTRMVRGEILSLKEREFAEAARALGFSRGRILFRHLLPNAIGPLIVVATLGVGNAIVLEAGLSYLGLGVQAGTPSWGSMVNAGGEYLMTAWWIATFPGLAIALAVLAFNLVGDGLRDVLDPRQGTGRAP
jgi:peptide/nickel transport system permease protein